MSWAMAVLSRGAAVDCRSDVWNLNAAPNQVTGIRVSTVPRRSKLSICEVAPHVVNRNAAYSEP